VTAYTKTQDPARRRHDLDWLRIIAFGLLIFYHVGMYYVTWDWHVKSPYAGPFLEPAMMLLNPWRLSLLFVISGVALRFAADKALDAGHGLRFGWQRFWQLFVPLLFGMFVVVAPQSYFELRAAGLVEPGFWAFYPDYVDFDQRWVLFTPTYNHLWYVLYLLIYTLALLPVLALVRPIAAPVWLTRLLRSPLLLVVPVLPFLLYRFTTDIASPETHDIMKDWGAHIRYGSFVLLGMLVAKSDAFWDGIRRWWRLSLGLAVGAAVVLTPVWQQWDALVVDGAAMNAARALRIFYIWWVIAALFGAAQQYLNRPGPRLTYLTEAVFPYYILHQTIIVVAGVFFSGFRMGGLAEFAAVVATTVAGCVLGHALVIRRLGILRPLFGLRHRTAAAPAAGSATTRA
jgi:hypothetical protein